MCLCLCVCVCVSVYRYITYFPPFQMTVSPSQNNVNTNSKIWQQHANHQVHRNNINRISHVHATNPCGVCISTITSQETSLRV